MRYTKFFYLQLLLCLLRHIPCPLPSYSQKESLGHTKMENIPSLR